MRDVISWSFPMGQLFGIAIRVHFVLPLVVIGLVGRQYMNKDAVPGSWEDVLILMVLMFLSILVHEFGHCFAARYMDGEADEVLLWPLGGLAFCRSLPHTPLAHFIFALGGPLVNIALFMSAGLLLVFVFDLPPPLNPFAYLMRSEPHVMVIKLTTWDGQSVAVTNVFAILLVWLFWGNWILTLFNLVLVGHPFDSGRMLQAVLWPRLGNQQASKISVYAGFVVMAVVGVCSIVWVEPLLAFLAMFIFVSCAQELVNLENALEESPFGYDFSQGYTSLEKDEPPPAPPKRRKQNFIQPLDCRACRQSEQQERDQRDAEDRRMDELLDKIQKHGKNSLSDEEHRFLKRVSGRFKNKP